jgi:hypothetical protein
MNDPTREAAEDTVDDVQCDEPTSTDATCMARWTKEESCSSVTASSPGYSIPCAVSEMAAELGMKP